MNSKLSTLLTKMNKNEVHYIESLILKKSTHDVLDKFILEILRPVKKKSKASPKMESIAYYNLIELLTEYCIRNTKIPHTDLLFKPKYCTKKCCLMRRLPYW